MNKMRYHGRKINLGPTKERIKNNNKEILIMYVIVIIHPGTCTIIWMSKLNNQLKTIVLKT